MNVTLTQLQGFVAVAEELHFGRAAERLNITQPPLTRQMQGLEKAVGAELFDRRPRGFTLTTAGEAFLVEARRILALTEGAVGTARRVAAGETGTLRLGFTAIGAYAVLGDLLSEVTNALPQLHIALEELVSEDQVNGVRSGMLDLGVVRPPVPTDLRSLLLHEEDLVLALPEDHRLVSRDRVALAEVTDDYIGYSPEGSQYLRTVCAALVGVEEFLQAQITSQVPTMLALVRARRGIALIPRSCTAMRVEGVVFRDLQEQDARGVHLHLCWNPASTNPIVHRVARLLGEVAPLGHLTSEA